MRQILKRIGVVLGSLFGLILLAIAAVYILSNARFNQVSTATDEITTY